MQYIGQLQNEQGYFVVSQLFGVSPSNISLNDIENGQFRAMAKPGDGIRSVYLPKDLNDFSYYNCGFSTSAATNVVRMRNGGRD